MRKFSLIVAVSALQIATVSAEVVATQIIETETTAISANGERSTKRVVADKVEPGETLFYTLNFRNQGGEAAGNMILVMDVPDEVVYVEGSIIAPTSEITFSADGGETYVARGRLTVVEDGKQRAARGDDITHIRFSLADPIAPGAAGKVSFRAILQ